ncbi:TetR/AcrR family transcriptional regulator [Streptomyces boncukensis]|uniref:TetR/AcrR family transcriptional regulator n=1 Tax=Streptomyces boncukensis TaxID=2711219 RepID=A0A6G4WTT7_9ACTN|nr:TetR/AcrR family transcriptional regulator [Streptomyces boncukensis]NGO68413.1 TetR/AcrR family transcriptional regulator [Streptomyces boncukensis]
MRAMGKERYHHGDLRNALIEAAIGLAREGGPEAVVLRAAARRVGVSPTAAYRHFAGQSELLGEVKEYGQRRLADCMEEAGGAVAGEGPEAVLARIRALGRGYVRFAMEEPGLFSAAFHGKSLEAVDGGQGGGFDLADQPWQARSFELLTESLDALLACGLMPPARRPGAEVGAWATAHGLARLVLDGPLSGIPAETFEPLIDRVLSDFLAGLTAPVT